MNPITKHQIKEKMEEILGGHGAHGGGHPHHAGHRPVLYVRGLNHVNTPITQRERYALSSEQCARVIRQFSAAGPSKQILVLSTCNRTEIYAYSVRKGFDSELHKAFLAIGGQTDPAAGEPPTYEYEGLEAVRHLFAVGAGLDSMILGENQIKMQLNQAYELSRAEGVDGTELSRLVDATNRTGKRIRTETELNTGTLCVGKAAVLKAEQVLGELRGKVCMVIGAGKIGGLAARAIAERHPARLWIVNRTLEKAREIAEGLGAEAYGLESLSCLLPEAEFILGAAYAPELILDRKLYETYCPPANRPARICVVDAAVPRIIDASLGTLPGVEVYDIEHMEEITEENRQRRIEAARKAWRILEEEVEKYRVALKAAELAPIIQKMHKHVDEIFNEEQTSLGPQCGEEFMRKIETMHRRIKQRLMHEVIQEIKSRLVE